MPAATARKTASATTKRTAAAKAAAAVKQPKKAPAAPPPATEKPMPKAAKESPKKAATAKEAAKKDASKSKPKKIKIVRDSFTMPEPEYKVLGEVKRACLKAGIAVKKSELLRVGVALLQKLKLEELQAALAGLTPVKAGRPKGVK